MGSEHLKEFVMTNRGLTYPRVYRNGNGTYTCEMIDKSNGTVWSTAECGNRNGAIAKARKGQPQKQVIRQANGFIRQHPFLIGASVGVIIAFMARDEDEDFSIGTTVMASLIFGTLAWAVVRICEKMAD